MSKEIKKLGPYQIAPDYSENIDLISPREEDLENDELTIRIGALSNHNYSGYDYEYKYIDITKGDIGTGISLEKGATFLVRDRTKTSVIRLSPDKAGTRNVIRGNETLEICSHKANTEHEDDSYISFATQNAGIRYLEGDWEEYFKQLNVRTSKGINMEAANNSYWWVNAEKKAVYGNSLNKLEFRTDGEAKFSKDVRAKNIKAEGTLTAKNVDVSGNTISLAASSSFVLKPFAGSISISGIPHIEMETDEAGDTTTNEWNDVVLSSSDNIILESERDVSIKAANKILINDIDVVPKLKAIPGATPTAINDNFSYVPVEGSDGVTRYMLVANTVEALTNLVTA